jgi:hypothetical protein
MGLNRGYLPADAQLHRCLPSWPPFAFTDTVKRALVDVTGTSVESQEEKMRIILA